MKPNRSKIMKAAHLKAWFWVTAGARYRWAFQLSLCEVWFNWKHYTESENYEMPMPEGGGRTDYFTTKPKEPSIYDLIGS